MYRTNNRGFTLIELMVSLTAGLVVSASAFMMARSATSFFQHESGITSAQYSVMLGFSRLQADFKNAAYLSTPNVLVDSGNGQFCGTVGSLPGGAPHPGMNDLAGVNIVADGSYNAPAAAGPVQNQWTANGLAPDSITISGSFDTTEQFAAAAVRPEAGGAFTVVLNEVNDGATIRTRLSAARGGATFTDIFRTGRILRVRDREGRFSLGVITGVTDIAGKVSITVGGAVPMGKREINTTCGCSGFCVGAPVSVVSRMHYSLRSVLGVPEYVNLFPPGSVVGFHRGASLPDTDRAELTRVELATDGTEMAGTLQIYAEYAVDLEFGLTYEAVAVPTVVPTLVREPVGTMVAGYTIAGRPSGGTPGRPDLIRTIQVRLSTRAPRRDRDSAYVNPLSDGTRLRFALGPGLGFARMRTLVADISLSNQTARLLP